MLYFTANEAKTQFGDMISKAQHEPIRVTKNGKPSVVVLSVEEYNKLEAIKLQYQQQNSPNNEP